MSTDAPSRARSTRRGELDLLGVLIIIGLVFFHTGQIFYGGDFYVQNEPYSPLALAFVAFASLWGMPLMFLMAGIAIWYSLGARTAGEFVRNRVRRLLIPFVVGVPLLVPPQVYCKLLGDPAYQKSYLEFLPRFFNVRPAWSFPLFIEGELFAISTLYFLIYLFAFTLLLLPLFLRLRKPAGRPLLERLADVFARPWAIFSLALPVAIIEAALGTESPGAWNRFAWLPFIIYGFLFAGDGRFEGVIRGQWKRALVLGIVAYVAWMIGMGMQLEVLQIDPSTDMGPIAVSVRFLKGIASWFWVIAILGLVGRASRPRAQKRPRTIPSRDRIIEYAQDARLPFYVLHQTAIVVVGFQVVQWETSALLKYVVISLSTLVITLVVYDVGVRRTRLTRFLFGMKQRPS